MRRNVIPVSDLEMTVFSAWNDRWFLLTAGENAPGAFNTMTVAWGSFGVMWSRPFAQVVVRPTRHTYAFMEKHDTFTLCAFPDELKSALQVCGTKSGRDIDKVRETGLTPIASTAVAAPGFDEAELVIECRTIFRDQFAPDKFLDTSLDELYDDDYHAIYYGEILAIQGTDTYRK